MCSRALPRLQIATLRPNVRARVFVLGFLIAACAREEKRRDEPEPAPVETVAPSGGATVRGRVLLEGPTPPLRLRPITVGQDVCGDEPRVDRSLVVDTRGHVAWAAILLVGTSSSPAPRRATIDHARCEFYPYITVVPPGSRVRVENSDSALHGLRLWGSDDARALPPGGALSFPFPREEKARIVCDLHYWSSAWVIVSPAAFHAVTDANGSFAITGVPPGRFRLIAWHERFGEVEREIEISGEEGVAETLAFPSIAPTPPPTP